MDTQHSLGRGDTAVPSMNRAHAALAADGRHLCLSRFDTTASTQAPSAVQQLLPQPQLASRYLSPAPCSGEKDLLGAALPGSRDSGCMSCPHHQLQ